MIDIEDIRKDHGVDIAFIILISRVYFKTATNIEVQEFVEKHEINWEQFLVSSRLHNVRPVVYKTLISIVIPIPSDVVKIMKGELSFLIANNWNLGIETERLSLLLSSQNIQALPYKGAAFGKQFYGDLTSREGYDIDFAIKKEDLAKVISIMEQDGYLVFNEMYYYLGEHRYIKEYKDISFNKFSNGGRLYHTEFHWTVEERFLSMHQNVSNLFSNAGEKITLFKKPLASLGANKHFVAIVINHVFRDVLKDIKPLLDIGKCIEDHSQVLNWVEIDDYLENLKLRKGFNSATLFVEQLLGVKNKNNINSKVPEQVIKQFKKHALRLHPTGWIYSGSIAFISTQLALRENLKDKLGFSTAYLRYCFYPTEIELQIVKLPKKMIFIYPVLRLFRILLKLNKLFLPRDKLKRNN